MELSIIENRFNDHGTIKILEQNSSLKPLKVLQEAIFQAQDKRFQKKWTDNIFDLPLIYSSSTEFYLNQHFNFTETEKQFLTSLKKHKYIQNKYIKLYQDRKFQKKTIQDFEIKMKSLDSGDLLVKYLSSGDRELRQLIINRLEFDLEQVVFLDQVFFCNPFLTKNEIDEGGGLLGKFGNDIESQASFLFDIRKDVTKKNKTFFEKLQTKFNLNRDEIMELNLYFNPKIYHTNSELNWSTIPILGSEIDILYHATVVVILFYNVKIEDAIWSLLLEKLNLFLSKLEQEISKNENKSENVFLLGRFQNLKTLVFLFSSKPKVDLKTRSLIREISITQAQDKGLLTWDYVLSTPYYNDIINPKNTQS